jgi:hypothetical protein
MSLSTLAVATPVAPPLKSRRLVRKTSPFYLALLGELGGEDAGANQQFYLVTISRVLPRVVAATGYRALDTLTRQDVEGMVRDSFDNPLPGTSAGGCLPTLVLLNVGVYLSRTGVNRFVVHATTGTGRGCDRRDADGTWAVDSFGFIGLML